MKVAVVGSRSFDNYTEMCRELDKMEIAEIVSGGAKGADSLAKRYASERGLSYKEFLPDWNLHGKAAGFIRNKLIVNAADEVVAFWNGHSNGTLDTMSYTKKVGKKLTVFTPHGRLPD